MHDRGRHDDDDEVESGQMLGHLLDELKSYARARPIESLMGAFILGILVVLLGRKDR